MAHNPVTDDRFGAQSDNPTSPDHLVWKPLTCLMGVPFLFFVSDLPS
jgi:hypothetical protein